MPRENKKGPATTTYHTIDSLKPANLLFTQDLHQKKIKETLSREATLILQHPNSRTRSRLALLHDQVIVKHDRKERHRTTPSTCVQSS
jgi:hypothetical protein